MKKRISEVAKIFREKAYESEFGGKDRGRFQITRTNVKKMLGVSRLHDRTVEKLIDACLAEGLVLMDMDDNFAIGEAQYISKWRKIPARLIEEYTHELELSLGVSTSGRNDDELDDE